MGLLEAGNRQAVLLFQIDLTGCTRVDDVNGDHLGFDGVQRGAKTSAAVNHQFGASSNDVGATLACVPDTGAVDEQIADIGGAQLAQSDEATCAQGNGAATGVDHGKIVHGHGTSTCVQRHAAGCRADVTLHTQHHASGGIQVNCTRGSGNGLVQVDGPAAGGQVQR